MTRFRDEGASASFSARRVLAASAAVALSIGLAACGDGDGDEPDPDLPAAEADLAGASDVVRGIETEELEPSEDTGLQAPGFAVDITASTTSTTLNIDAYEDISGSRPEASEGEEEPDVVRAEDGHVFLVAAYETSDPGWQPQDVSSSSEGRLVVDGTKVAEILDSEDSVRQSGTLVVSIPEDHDPESVVLELETDGVVQSVSLVDGTRVDADIPQAYPGPVEVEVADAERLDVTFDHWSGGETAVQGEVVGAFATSYLPRERGGDGWAAPGQRFVSIDVDWSLNESVTYDRTTMRLEGSDGSTFQLINKPRTLVDVFGDPAVFQVPADLDELTVVIDPAYRNGVLSDAPTLEFDTVTATLRVA